MIMGGLQEFLEFRVGDRKLINPKGSYMESMVMISARRIFPRVLNVHAHIV